MALARCLSSAASADKLARFALLRDTLSDPLYWGGHTAGASYDPADSQLTLFNPLVWRRMYLSLFMFPGPYRIERADPYLLLWIPYQFRSKLDMGAYPYPFWHSKKKWDSYQLATELILVFEKGKIIAAYRSDSQDPGRPYLARVWDGEWHWTDAAGQEQPYVSLYTYLFSAANPHVTRLDAAYRALEAEARRLGVSRLLLETGPLLTHAIALYERCGFVAIEQFGEYVGSNSSYCMGKDL